MSQLPPQERDVLRLLGQGRTTDEIARRLGITESTVVWHVSRAVTRYGPRRTEQLALSLARESRRRVLALATAFFVALVLTGAAVANTDGFGPRHVPQPLAPPPSAPPTPSFSATPDVHSNGAPDASDVPTPADPNASAEHFPSAMPMPQAPPTLGPPPSVVPFVVPSLPPPGTPIPIPTIALPTVPLPSVPLATPGLPRIP